MLDTSRYAELFLSESRDNIVAVNEALLRLERDFRDREAVDAAFRAIHTIKGMAGVMGFAAVSDLAHDMEAILSRAREQGRGVRASDPPLLLEATDVLESAIERAVAGGPAHTGIDSIRARLEIAPSPGPAGQEPGSGTLAPADGMALLVRLEADTPLRGARAVVVL